MNNTNMNMRTSKKTINEQEHGHSITNDGNGLDIIGNFGFVVRGTSEEAKKLMNYAQSLGMYVVYRTASSEKLWVVPESDVELVDEQTDE